MLRVNAKGALRVRNRPDINSYATVGASDD